MLSDWTFKEWPVGLIFRQPTAGEFFTTDAVSGLGEALVREGIQNSLDATDVEGGRTANVRIALLSEELAPSGETLEKIFQNAWPHIRAKGNGLTPDLIPEKNKLCRAIVLEDFEARGLEGEPDVAYPPDEREKNHFFYFFRAEALTDKDNEVKRGSWGLGKDTFIRASQINTLFGLTVRQSDKCRMLMGKTVLKTHKLNGKFHQDGFFGNLDETSGLVMPITDSAFLDEFANQFRLNREGRTGLSVIVPWPHDEIKDTDLLESVLRNYAYCILKGQLRVEVEAGGISKVVNTETLIQAARDFSESLEASLMEDFLGDIELADWATKRIRDNDRFILEMPPANETWKWKKSLFPKGILDELRDKLQNQQKVAVRVPVTVRPKGKKRGESESFFDVYMSVDDSDVLRKPICIRNGILISDAGAVRPRKGVRSLIVVEDQPLAELLQNSENPSHTLWQEKKLKSEYYFGPGCLAFIRQSVKQICALAMAEDKGKDRKLLTELFPVVKKGTPDPWKKRIEPLSVPQLNVRKLSGGFCVVPGTIPLEEGSLVEVKFAYDSRDRDPIKAYSPFDFRIGDAQVESQFYGVEKIGQGDNWLLLRILSSEDFRAEVTGFDQNRQVFVKVEVKSKNAQ